MCLDVVKATKMHNQIWENDKTEPNNMSKTCDDNGDLYIKGNEFKISEMKTEIHTINPRINKPNERGEQK